MSDLKMEVRQYLCEHLDVSALTEEQLDEVVEHLFQCVSEENIRERLRRAREQ